MSTQQIFDYLEGRLTADERAMFEKRIASEPALQKDLEAAREMERGFGALRKVAPPVDLVANTRRQINAGKAFATESDETRHAWHFPTWAWPLSAAAIVLFGFGFIFLRDEMTRRRAQNLASENAPRSSVASSETMAPASAVAPLADAGSLSDPLAKAAERNLPAPVLASEQIALPSPANELDARTDEVIRIVSAVGGTALKGNAPAGEQHVLAYIPQDEIENFRKAIARVSDADASRDNVLAMDKLTAAEKDSVRKALDMPALQTKTSKVSADRKTSEKENESVALGDLAKASRAHSLALNGGSSSFTAAPATAPMPASAAPAKAEPKQSELSAANSLKTAAGELRPDSPANPEPKRELQMPEKIKQLARAEEPHPAPTTPQEMPAGVAGKIETARTAVNKDTSGTVALSNGTTPAVGIVLNGGTLQLRQRAKSENEFRSRSETTKKLPLTGASLGLAGETSNNQFALQNATDASEKKKTEKNQKRQFIEIIIRSTPREK